MRKLTNREKIIGLATFFVVGIYVMVFVFMRLNNMLTSIDEGIATSQERLDQGRQRVQSGVNIKESLGHMIKEWGVDSSNANESTELINALETAATTSGIRIINIEPRPVIRDVLVRHPIALTISGASKDLIRFLYIIQSKPLALSVENLNIERAVDGNAVISGSVVVTRLRIIR